MSNGSLALTNKQQKHPKFTFQNYLKNYNEPYDDESHDTLFNRETVLKENSYMMRRQLRRIAQRVRTHYF